ncbi:hypothetical protein BaRGS_00034930 [Batillaria attramentaria]|uniref:Uncharacterized protein n=1 Tax=Batillaria attramentaria TaxID=370345 RepID=A0ABD0JG35_9CAEN
MATPKNNWQLSKARAVFLAVLCLSCCQVRGLYEECQNADGEFAACHPDIEKLVPAGNFTVTLDPEDSTCGTPRSSYRRLGDRMFVDKICDALSTDVNINHDVSYMTDVAGDTTWWQSVTMETAGPTQPLLVNITLSFNKTYHLMGDLTITFNSGRPEVMILEKSVDYGLTWSPLQYYARNCREFYDRGAGYSITVNDLSAVICDNTSVEITSFPRPGGKVIFGAVGQRLKLLAGPTEENFAQYFQSLDTSDVMEFLSFTDLRIRLLETATDGGTNYNMYYYAISDIEVLARCDCNLHGSRCVADETGRAACECSHNTAGRDCELCQPLYNDRPWQKGLYTPFSTGTANECKIPTNGSDVTLSGTLSVSVNGNSGADVTSYGTDVTTCQQTPAEVQRVDFNFTSGVAMAWVSDNVTVPLDVRCRYDVTLSISGNGNVISPVVIDSFLLMPALTSSSGNTTFGVRSSSETDVVYHTCLNQLAALFTRESALLPGTCRNLFLSVSAELYNGGQACDCDPVGTEPGTLCAAVGGQCHCKAGVAGRRCDQCRPGYYDLTLSGCTAVECTAPSCTVVPPSTDPPPSANSTSSTNSSGLPEGAVTTPSSDTGTGKISTSPGAGNTTASQSSGSNAGDDSTVYIVVASNPYRWGETLDRNDNFRSQEFDNGAYSDNDFNWNVWNQRAGIKDGDRHSPSPYRPPVFFLHSADSSDGDSVPARQRNGDGTFGNGVPNGTRDAEGLLAARGRLDPNSQLQRQSKLHNEKLPSFSALDRSRKPRVMRDDTLVDYGDDGMVYQPLSFDTFRSSSPPLAVIRPTPKLGVSTLHTPKQDPLDDGYGWDIAETSFITKPKPVPGKPVFDTWEKDTEPLRDARERSFRRVPQKTNRGTEENAWPDVDTPPVLKDAIERAEKRIRQTENPKQKKKLGMSYSAPERPTSLSVPVTQPPDPLPTSRRRTSRLIKRASSKSRPGKAQHVPALVIPNEDKTKTPPKKPKRKRPPSNAKDSSPSRLGAESDREATTSELPRKASKKGNMDAYNSSFDKSQLVDGLLAPPASFSDFDFSAFDEEHGSLGGSRNGACDVISGQCQCLQNVASAMETGTSGVAGDLQCSQCRQNFYGHGSTLGCLPCNCHQTGSTNPQCTEEGQCPCVDSVGGRQCDQCRPGFFAFGTGGCSPCGCDLAGSLNGTCDQTFGTCQCKGNVEGTRCDVCKAGYFNLAASNPSGCQPCFCFQHGTVCTSATGFIYDTITSESSVNWNVTDTHFLAPPQFLGDQHVSYGQLLSFYFTGALPFGQVANATLVILEGDQEQSGSVKYVVDALTPATSTSGQVDVRFLAGEWRRADDTDAEESEMLRILADLTALKLPRQLGGTSFAYTDIVMETALAGSEGNVSTHVENCTCDTVSAVSGLSCENCSPGTRRMNVNLTSPYQVCTACDCSGRGLTTPPECDQWTGVCLNCRNGTVGDRCQSCAPFVQGAECDECEDGYWGLGPNGCEACNCSDPGSTSSLCDKDSGQCSCAPFVTGRMCERCEENYHSLSATGCQECDECYKLVMGEVTALRQLVQNMTSSVLLLETNDQTPNLGFFVPRLNDAVDTSQQLLTFLEDTTAAEDSVRGQLVTLTSLTQELSDAVTRLAENTTSDIEAVLSEALVEYENATLVKQAVTDNVQSTYDQIGTLASVVPSLDALAASLETVEVELRTRAQNSETARQAALSELQDLEQVTVQSALGVHQNNSRRMTQLEGVDVTLNMLATETLTEGRQVRTKSAEVIQSAQGLQTAVATIGQPNIDVAGLSRSVSNVTSRADLLQAQATEADTNFASRQTEIDSAVVQTEALRSRVQALVDGVGGMTSRLTSAERQARAAEQEANSVFQSAENMLQTMQNFEVMASEVEQKTNTSLATVEDMRQASADVRAEAAAVTTSLAASQQAASQAIDIARQAKAIADLQYARLSPVAVSAQALQNSTSTELDNATAAAQRPDALLTSVVQPANETCAEQQQLVANVRSKVESAASSAQQATTRAVMATNRANLLLSNLRNIPSVDLDRIQTLLAEVNSARAQFNATELRSAIAAVQASSQAQAAKIAVLKARKAELQAKIEQLRVIQQQLLP